MLEVVFWVCLGFLAYIYVGYPTLVWLLSRIIGRDIEKADIEPTVTVVIAAYNEEDEIELTVANMLSQDYPADRLKVIVVSDCSTDRTDAIVRRISEVSGERLRLMRQEPRQGKTQALNWAAAQTCSDILVVCDANSRYARDAIRWLVRSFADPTTGYVTGQMIYTNDGEAGIGEGSRTYMRYENLLRFHESHLNSVVGVDGGIDAVRRDLYVTMRPDQLPDLVLPLNVVAQGRRVVYEPNAKLYEPALRDASDEFRMRVRVSLRALWALHDKRGLLNPFRYPLFAWQLLSHKVLRYGAFMPLIGLLLSNVFIAAKHPVYFGFLVVQLSAYLCAFLGPLFSQLPAAGSKLLAPYYFVILNAACAVALWNFGNGRKMVLWTPRRGGGGASLR